MSPDRASFTADDSVGAAEQPGEDRNNDADDAAADAPENDIENNDLADSADDQAAGDDSAARRRMWMRVCVAVLVALLVATAGLTAWLYIAKYRPVQRTDQFARERALDAAKEGTVAALSYSPENLDKNLAAAKSHLTGDFLQYYSHFTDEVVRPAVNLRHVFVTANVVRAAISEMHPDTAKVILFVNETSISSDRPEPSVAASTVFATMQKVNGKWLIAAFAPV